MHVLQSAWRGPPQDLARTAKDLARKVLADKRLREGAEGGRVWGGSRRLEVRGREELKWIIELKEFLKRCLLEGEAVMLR
jgi:hypothetical protein